ncbi:MAG: M3 family metallopeptidase [Flavobacteriaceae bacterium]|nr:M3 family metallopeptidase [Flavobacteriaceae bacterium]
MNKNPLLTPFEEAPFSRIKNEHFTPAFEVAIEQAREEIEAITENSEEPTFENTIEALDYSGRHLQRISSIFFNLNAAETNPEIQQIAQKISPKLTQFQNDITLNQALFDRVKQVYEKQDQALLTPEQKTLLDKKFKSFSRNGAMLSDNDKQQLRKIDERLAKLKLQFGEHVLAETNAYELWIQNKADLEGLPESIIEAAAIKAREKEKEAGWVFTLDYPSFVPFMKYAKNRELRRELYLAFGSRGFHGDERDNKEVVLEIARLRYERAALLGYDSHAAFVLEERMAESPENVLEFLDELLEKALPAAKKELAELQEFARQNDGLSELQKWDTSFYSEQLRNRKFNLDDEQLKPYFQLENVIGGVFKVASLLFGLQFEETSDVETYHPDVKTFRVFDQEQKEVALFYADFHPRPGKRNGAWMTSYRGQYKYEGKEVRPHVSIVCNFTKPTENNPSLLTFNEVTTLFHEFGHALHGMLADTKYKSLSGTSVHWDFVELPSQILENWCYEEESLKLFAKHYETGEIIPMELVQKIKDSSNFLEGMATLRQLSYAMLDMAWHHSYPGEIPDIKAFETDASQKSQLFPETEGTCMSTAFAHIFQGGYSSGYYSYKWAEVLDADAFAHFKEKGIFDREIAHLFQEHILSKGGTEEPMILYERFRGRKPKIDALLKRAGLA